ncbi:enoyl-CoA hydratase/isomerase family protein [Halobacillus amylolyticus]|uniref:Enoyl-CoA hydratase/isomerase family protein n=1 Tax=Halobacillus amylolyticus TaxID=2932259 RepID=A0ABY4HHM4_9BACI|nr:enoyl-CoA hydratase/isomerase family protein [Halobacillus amylolyticus]UOR12935.1 enoyl-CoA hydratase/isomerase family protein [Halobacillus amylolyticus]
MGQVILSVSDRGYAHIVLNRPEKMNAITQKVISELRDALKQARAIENLKCLVISGAGDRAFCAGGDLQEFHGELTKEEAYRMLSPMKDALYELACFPLPTFAFLNGQARGGGCEIATACDFRYGLADSSYGFVQGQLGILPGWGGGVLLYKKIAAHFAAHWLMDARMYGTEEVSRMGWLHKVVSKQQLAGEELLQPFLEKSQEQLRLFKKQYSEHLSIEGLLQQMDEEVQQCSGLWESEAHVQAVRRFTSSRKKS